MHPSSAAQHTESAKSRSAPPEAKSQWLAIATPARRAAVSPLKISAAASQAAGIAANRKFWAHPPASFGRQTKVLRRARLPLAATGLKIRSCLCVPDRQSPDPTAGRRRDALADRG